MKEIQSVEEFNTVTESEGLVVVDFWAPWCGPCKAFAPVLEEVQGQVGPLAEIVKVNIEEVPELSARFGVRSIPTLVLIKDGVVVDQHSGTMPAASLRQLIEAQTE